MNNRRSTIQTLRGFCCGIFKLIGQTVRVFWKLGVVFIACNCSLTKCIRERNVSVIKLALMNANYVQRLRMTFSKGGAARYTSHLDLARALERALNRAKIPVAYTQGFNRRPRMQMATALPLGYTSEYELSDIMLLEPMEAEAARVQLMSKMAPGIDVFKMEEVPIEATSLQASTIETTYMATLLDPYDVALLQKQVDKLLAQERIMMEKIRKKKVKQFDLRPLIIDLKTQESDEGLAQIWMRLYLQPSKTGRPDDVLKFLNLDPLDARIHRLKIVLEGEIGD